MTYFLQNDLLIKFLPLPNISFNYKSVHIRALMTQHLLKTQTLNPYTGNQASVWELLADVLDANY